MLLIAIVLAWISYTLVWIWQRHERVGGGFQIREPDWTVSKADYIPISWPYSGPEPPIALRLFGEHGYGEWLDYRGPPRKIHEAMQLFPESAIWFANGSPRGADEPWYP
jgi:hypothetical protein